MQSVTATGARSFSVAAPRPTIFGILSLQPSECVPVLTPSVITSRPTINSSRPSNHSLPTHHPLAPQLRPSADYCAPSQIMFTYLLI